MSLLAYVLFAVLPLFIPGGDWTHFPPYMALPQGGFDLSDYYLLYSFICINALFLFGFYFFGLRIAARDVPDHNDQKYVDAGVRSTGGGWLSDRSTRLIFGFAVLFHIVMLLTPFLLSTDIFDYIRHGRIFAIYGENPLVVPATFFPQDPFFSLGGWVGTGSVYGPVHVYVAAALSIIAGDGFAANFLIFKSFFIGMNLVNLVLIGVIARRLWPGLEKKAMLFYGWNPLILFMVAANAHNDILMLTLVLAGILCLLSGRVMLGVLALTLGTLVKFIALPILVVYVALVVKKQRGVGRRLLMGGVSAAVVLGTTIVSYLPLWEGSDTFTYLTTVGMKTNFTVPSLLRDVAAGHLRFALSSTIVELTLAGLLAGYMVWHAIGVKNVDGFLSAAAGLAFLTPLALFWFQPWYLTLALGLVALRPWRFMYRAALVFSFSVMFFDSFWWHTPVSMDIQKPLRAFVVFGPPIAILFVLKARKVIPAAWRRMMAWSLEGEKSVAAVVREVSDPSLKRVALEISALFAAAAVPMSLIVSTSPQLRALANLVAVKLQLITHL